METVFHGQGPVVVAHRGSRLLWPENTMTAFENAASHGVRFFETDLRASADGVLHCFHDFFLDRTTDGSGPIASKSAAELARLDAGYRHRQGDGFPFRGQAIGIPTLEAVLDRFPDAGFVVDLKADGVVEPLSRLVRERHLEGRLIAGSFSTARLAELQERCRAATATGPLETIRAMVGGRLDSAIDPFGPSTVSLSVPVSWYGVPVVTPELVEVADRHGRLIQAWTINEPEEMKKLVELGVDGIITDRPDLAAGII